MILKKYNIFVYFIILLILVVNVVISEENTLEPSSTTSSKANTTLVPSSSIENVTESCLSEAACITANSTLKSCNGNLTTPDKYIEEGKRSGVYKPPAEGALARCMCNQPYYEALSTCIECFSNVTKLEFSVSPLQQYKDQCKKAGTTFTQTMPEMSSGFSKRLKWGIIGVLIAAFLATIGFFAFKYYKRKKSIKSHKISVEGGGISSTDNSKYPPPPSPSAHFKYQYAPPTDTPYYPPPPGAPPPSEQQYPPPPGAPPPSEQQYPLPPQQQYRGQGQGQGGQGGHSQSDSYYDGSY